MDKERVLVDIDAQGIAHVQLNRPDKLNALDMPMFHAIDQAAQDLQTDKNLRCVILSGKGRAFCTGLDVASVASRRQHLDTLLQSTSAGRVSNLAQDIAYRWRELPVPVICVLHGMAFGGGLQLALGADMRYATPHCRISIMEAKYGLIPDMSASVTLRELVPIDLAKEWTYTGRIFEAAAAGGLVTRICDDPWHEARTTAEEIVQRSPDAVQLAKKLYQTTYREKTASECLALESNYQKRLLVTWNQLAASASSLTGWKVPFLSKQQQGDEKDQ